MATDEQVAGKLLETAFTEAANPYLEIQIRSRRTVRKSDSDRIKAICLLRGLSSSKRGLSVARFEAAQ